MKGIALLGSTGSVGVNTLRVIESHPDSFRVVGLAARSNISVIHEQVLKWKPRYVALSDKEACRSFQSNGGQLMAGLEGIRELVVQPEVDLVVAASSGSSCLVPVLDAIRAGKHIALANKEILVMAGDLLMQEARRRGVSIIPIDSEHSAIFQCLQGHSEKEIQSLYLTGTGGPLRDFNGDSFAGISKEVVMNHPKWRMGQKISVDSATLMNKGLEVIEARSLFGVDVEQIKVLVHPEAIVHSMVEFKDGVILAQMGVTDMRLPIQYALSFPKRLGTNRELFMDFSKPLSLHFSAPNYDRFPCLKLAYAATRRAGSAPCVLNAANEVAVSAFLNDKIDFIRIPAIVEEVLSKHHWVEDPVLAQILEWDAWAREEALRLC